MKLKNFFLWYAWVAHSVGFPTVDFSSGLNLRVMNSSPALGSMLDVELTFKKIRTKQKQKAFFCNHFKKIIFLSIFLDSRGLILDTSLLMLY